MHLNNEEEEHNLTLARFESMLKTNEILFFDSEEFENIILHYLDTGKLIIAKKALKLGLEQHPDSIGLKLVEVEMLIFQNKLEAADRLLNQIEEVEANNEEIYIQRATIYSKKGLHHEAIEQFNIALSLTDDLADVYSLLGMEYLMIDDIVKAKENFILCLEHDEEDQSALYNVVYCFDYLNEHEEAVTFLKEFIDRKPYSEIAWHQLGREYYALKKYKKAVWAFDYATLIDENFVGAYLEKGKALEKDANYKEAIKSYLITLDIADATSYVLLRIGSCYEKLDDFLMAHEYYKKAIHEDPMLDKGWIALTDLSIKELNYEKALMYLQKAISIDEFNPKYWIRYAILNKSLFNFKEVEKGYTMAIECSDYVLEYWLGLTDVLFILEKYEEAIQKLQQIMSTYQDNIDILYRLAVQYLALQDFDNAQLYLIKALKIDSGKADVIEKLFPIYWSHPVIVNTIKRFKAK